MSQSIQAFAIGEIAIRQHDGLYSLNDLHKAAGGEARHKPSEWLRNQQAQELVQEIGKAGIPALDVKKGGKNPGAYACHELVIAYAAWISATFHLKVIRVFLAVAAPSTPYSVPPGQTLSAEQADTLRELLTSHVKKLPKPRQGKAMVQGWSKLKAHFGTDYRHIPASEYHEAVSIIARHTADWELVDETPVPALPRLHLYQTPPAVGTYRYNPANPHPANGRTIEVAKSIAADIRNWSDNLPAGPARQDLHDAAQTLYDLLVSGCTEVDEALGQLHTAMHYLNRWQGRGGRIGNTR